MSHKIAVTTEQIDMLRSMYMSGNSREEMSNAIGKSLKDIGELLNTYHIVGEMPSHDYDKEMDFSEQIYDFWEKLGYHIEMKTSVYGYNRSNMKNGLPQAIEKYNPKKHSEIGDWTKESVAPIITKNKEKR